MSRIVLICSSKVAMGSSGEEPKSGGEHTGRSSTTLGAKQRRNGPKSDADSELGQGAVYR